MPAINRNLHPDTVIHAAIYARVSLEEKEGDEGFSLPQQIRACVEYARQYGFAVNEAHIFQDDMTGKLASRPGLDALHKVAAAGLIQAVIVYKMSRLGRTHYHQVVFMREMKAYGVEIYDTSTAPGKPSPERTLLLNMLSLIAEYEHAIILDRMEQGRRGRAEAGFPRKQKPTYGYRYVELVQEDGTQYERAKYKRSTRGYYEIVPEEAEFIRRIFLWYVEEGWTIYQIVAELNRSGVPTIQIQRGYKKRVAGTPDVWQASTIQTLLSKRARVYTGVQYYGQTQNGERKANGRPTRILKTSEDSWIAVAVPPIISAELYAAAQARSALNKAQASRNRKYYYLFSGLITCGVCSKLMHGRQQGRERGVLRQYYQCNRHEGGVRPVCSRLLNGKRLEAAVWATVQERFRDADKALALFLEQGVDPEAPRPSLMKREYLEKELRQALLKLERLEQAYYVGAESPEEYKEKKERFTREKEVVATKMAAVEAAERQTIATEEAKAELWEILNGIARVIAKAQTPEERRHVLNLLRMSIVYLPDKKVELTVQPLEPPVRGVVLATVLHFQHGYNNNAPSLTWIVAA